MDPHAPNRQRPLFNVGCTKRTCSEGDRQPGELRFRQDPTLAQRVAERERVPAAAIAARPPPAPPRPVGRPRLGRPAHHSWKRSLWCGFSCCPCGCPAIRCMWACACASQAEQQQRQRQQLIGTSSTGYGSGWKWADEGMCTCSYGPHRSPSWSNGVNGERNLHWAWQTVWEGWEVRHSALATAALQQQVWHFQGEPHPFLGTRARARITLRHLRVRSLPWCLSQLSGMKSWTRPAWRRWQPRQLLSKQGQQCERVKLALKILQHLRILWTQQQSQKPGGVQARAPGVAGEGALTLGRKQLIKEHKAQGEAGEGKGAGAGGRRGFGKSWMSWIQRPCILRWRNGRRGVSTVC